MKRKAFIYEGYHIFPDGGYTYTVGDSAGRELVWRLPTLASAVTLVDTLVMMAVRLPY